MDIIIWGLFFIIAVFDARDNRIPNKLLISIIVVVTINSIIFTHSVSMTHSLLGLVVLFSIGLLLFFVKAMAPGDVKLLGVVGYYIGFWNIPSFMFYTLISGAIVGSLYSLQVLADNPNQFKLMVNRYSTVFLYGKASEDLITNTEPSKKLRMPFGPVVVIGLALYSYFQ
ncbi:A24 family peptidase [Vibrio kagoshimensis]|uniref:A24 family peptidase n=1 Tax=Vibrio kagoshimensis TaxID=2910244 RepID=UPI003D1D71D4